MLKSFVLKQNKELGLRNIITHNLWYSKDIKEGIINNINYNADLKGLESDINREQIKQYIKDYYISLEDQNNFNKFIAGIKRYYNNELNNKEFLIAEGLNEYFNSINDLYNFIVNNIIPAVKEI